MEIGDAVPFNDDLSSPCYVAGVFQPGPLWHIMPDEANMRPGFAIPCPGRVQMGRSMTVVSPSSEGVPVM